MDESSLEFDTLAAQAGLRMRVGDTISTAPPIDASTTFTGQSVDEVHAALAPDAHGFAYARNANPTVVALEQALVPLEAAEDVVAFGSGMAAIQAALLGTGLEAGDAVVAATELYGVSRSLLTQLAGFDIRPHFVDILDLEQVEDALIKSQARVLYFETISNPLLHVADVRHLVALARERHTTVIVDNTFATPYLFRPLEHGAHIVVHSATKYIAGHGDVVAGLVATNRSLGKRIRDTRTVHGSILSPFEAWLTLRGLRTLPLRMTRQSLTALEIARYLAQQPWVERVYYPGLPSHPQHELAHSLLGDHFSGMVAFDLAAERTAALRFMDALKVIAPGTSLGDVESLILYPRLSSHRTLSPEELRAFGIGEGLVRLSVGLESPRDLIGDLRQAAMAAGLTQLSMLDTGGVQA